ncbi:MAG: glycosyltransferase family 2 protein [Aphanocapsa lilacina HA4352-LM1]|jgi:glycosyltransferase involved in cell wall biosynthesis|nr:glycosyltransferase family 2 protein [Aphanocapsa lilacina HA4352-LM1]
MTRIHALCLARNEGDVIAQTLLHASRFCHRIYVWDNGSEDDTWEQVKRVESAVIVPYRREGSPFHFGLRAQMFADIRPTCQPGDWIFVLDADEFLAESPRRAIAAAEREGARQINTLQYNFIFTDTDLAAWKAGDDSRGLPIQQRRRHYRFSNIEQRLFRVEDTLVWPTGVDAARPRGYAMPPKLKKCSRRIANCHYQYRDPEQMQLRLATRLAARAANRHNFQHYRDIDENFDWMRFVEPSANYHFYRGDGRFQITLAERARLFRRHFGHHTFFRFDFLA